jgi:hypothetical protein
MPGAPQVFRLTRISPFAFKRDRGSPSRLKAGSHHLGMAAICAKQPAGVDVRPWLQRLRFAVGARDAARIAGANATLGRAPPGRDRICASRRPAPAIRDRLQASKAGAIVGESRFVARSLAPI